MADDGAGGLVEGGAAAVVDAPMIDVARRTTIPTTAERLLLMTLPLLWVDCVNPL